MATEHIASMHEHLLKEATNSCAHVRTHARTHTHTHTHVLAHIHAYAHAHAHAYARTCIRTHMHTRGIGEHFCAAVLAKKLRARFRNASKSSKSTARHLETET